LFFDRSQPTDGGGFYIKKAVPIFIFLEELDLDGLVGDAGDHDGTSLEEVGVLEHGIKEDVARIHVLAGDHSEDVEVLRTVRQGQFNLHAVVIGVGEDAVLRNVLDGGSFLECGLLAVYRQYHKKIGWFTTKVSQPIRP